MTEDEAKELLKREYRELGFPLFATLVDALEPSVHTKAAVAAMLRAVNSKIT